MSWFVCSFIEKSLKLSGSFSEFFFKRFHHFSCEFQYRFVWNLEISQLLVDVRPFAYRKYMQIPNYVFQPVVYSERVCFHKTLDWGHDWKGVLKDRLISLWTGQLYSSGWIPFAWFTTFVFPEPVTLFFFPHRQSKSFQSVSSWRKIFLATFYQKVKTLMSWWL